MHSCQDSRLDCLRRNESDQCSLPVQSGCVIEECRNETEMEGRAKSQDDVMSTTKTAEPYTSLTFIDLPNPEAVRDPKKVRTARVHAVTVALARKRSKAQKDGSNFREERFHATKSGSSAKHWHGVSMHTAPAPSAPLGLSSLDPFETLPVNARRLTTLFHLKSSVRAGEPVFSLSDAIHFQSLPSIFESGLSDGALTAAIGLSMSYAASGWKMNDECLEFSSIAMHQIRQKLSDPTTAASAATIGTVLLLLGNAVGHSWLCTSPQVLELTPGSIAWVKWRAPKHIFVDYECYSGCARSATSNYLRPSR